ncbi:Fe(3+)-hydroxamate ABC transporter substrate-binding protein FhuD [Erwinia psidii]|uniref:Fe(3+)-hydroxamate ABC transporter substrate-binding protein FhuD n=1 Tax=Erwinia psidii TaxID=69224 RepID=A0A3N6RYY9_9GAMM|nr:Fe(3+)-hydroxamate ABC transporter substrate-binding protein FhuD [Erwinia psidii]MCX8957778.1 Fe(3+)-hydroxamate ABC transporter substrate-binding protein FhuD [Erwinia psidii]MCX8964933.1 Fe(3+)-hydroxamate ABC transporter substrate-binding protein FhuD [Erwinia psidii]RQM38394.1 Fe(3+)-hydroxamate ABC transporter substrate-binding protein FhuD [Erwinia psidii]
MPDYFRRRLLMALALSPLLPALPGRAASSVDIQRIIALEWLPVELLLALGVTPMGAAEMYQYKRWVGEPALPPSTVDVGLRTEPNLELLIQMKPSLILYSSGYGPSAAKIGQIAPGMGFPFSDASGKPLTIARRSLMQLAERLDRVVQAQQHLVAFDAFISAAKTRITARAQRPLLLMSILDPRHALVFGKGSLFLEVMEHLGIENAWQGETNFWGSAIVGLERLATMREVDAVCFDHGDDALVAQVTATPLWKAMPFVRENRLHRVPQVWFYGATLSAMRFCRQLDSVLGAA